MPLTPLTSQSSQIVFQDPGIVIAIHGTGSAKLTSGKTAMAIKVEQSVDIPPFANRATVFLNGWRLKYLTTDHNLLGLGTAILKIRFNLREHKLTWVAMGLIRDDDGKEGYDWTYRFTVIAWNNAQINAEVDHGFVDPTKGEKENYCSPSGGFTDNYFGYSNKNDTNTALSSVSSFIQNGAFATSRTVAVLPRGFVLNWGWCGGDHHLFQLGYNLDHSEIFAEKGRKYHTKDGEVDAPSTTTASQADSGFVSWNSYAILKDNDKRRDYGFDEVVSGMGGNDVRVLQPPFSILPAEDYGWFGNWGCGIVGSSPVRTEDFVIENVPFEYAIPMLGGWELKQPCDDRHVREAGIWIDEWSYQKVPGATGGTLRYKLSSTLHDDGIPSHKVAHKVAILGLRDLLGTNVIFRPKGKGV